MFRLCRVDFFFDIITELGIPVLKAAGSVLMRFLCPSEIFTCSMHEHTGKRLANRTDAKILFNNKRKKTQTQ